MAFCGFDADTGFGLEEVEAFSVLVGTAGCLATMLRAARGLSSSLSDI